MALQTAHPIGGSESTLISELIATLHELLPGLVDLHQDCPTACSTRKIPRLDGLLPVENLLDSLRESWTDLAEDIIWEI